MHSPEEDLAAKGVITEHVKPRAVPKGPLVLSVIDFADLHTIGNKSWVVRRLLGAGEVSCWFGPPGSGNSVLAEDMGLHVAASRTWQGREVKGGAVLFVALERAGVVARRAIAFGREHALFGSKLPFAVLGGPLDFRDPPTAVKIIATMQDLAARHGTEPRLIIVDTVSRALNGGDENSPKDMGALIATLGAILAALPGVHIMLVHHVPTDGKERMRGHGSLLGAVDAAFSVTASEAVRTAECVKSSDLEDEQRLGFTLKPVVVGKDEHGGDVSAPVVVVVEQVPASGGKRGKGTKIPKGARVALDALREVLSDSGAVPPASNHIPPNVKTVTVEQWRDYAYRRGITPSKEDRARQQAFQRAVGKLQDAKLVAFWGAHVWTI